ncbi:MAG: TonB family protein [Candidatus Sericytochromatia bacterium]|nr:TonB family protein [Candidatus Sericytochromatia bacterium]
MLRPLMLACALLLAPACPAGAVAPAREEHIRAQVLRASSRLADGPFLAELARLNRALSGQRLRRSGWIVATSPDAAASGLVAVHVSARPELPGPTWTAYLTEGYGMAPGDQLTWEGVIRRIDASGEVHLRAERVVQWVPKDQARFGEGRPRWEGLPPTVDWLKHGLAARPLLRRVEATVPLEALQDYVSRDVGVRVWVSPSGHVARTHVVRSSGRRDVDLAALEAVGAWRFAPWPAGPGLDQVEDLVVPVSAR